MSVAEFSTNNYNVNIYDSQRQDITNQDEICDEYLPKPPLFPDYGNENQDDLSQLSHTDDENTEENLN